MKRCTRLAALLAVAATAVGPAAAQDPVAGKAWVQLVSGPRPPQLGESVFLGVRFEIRPGWHIYWKNPGGAGLATDVQWRLPAGVEAGDLLWPVPVAFTQSGDIPGYGYEGEVVLAAELRSSGAVPDGAVVGASVSWLACKDVCVLGSAELESPWAEVPIDPEFAAWAGSLPRTFEGSDAPFSLTAKGGLAAGHLGLWLQWRTAPQSVEFFPDPPEGLEVKDVSIQTRGGLTRIDAVLRPMAGSESRPDSLDAVVVLADENNRRRGWELAVDLTSNER
jgi:DsbC/DsbD-like thiol-disulfide interchange protein